MLYSSRMSDSAVDSSPTSPTIEDPEVVVVGAGLSGLVAATELTAAGRRVVLLDQEPAASLGGQVWWACGGLFLVGSPEQRRMGVTDSAELAFDAPAGAALGRPRHVGEAAIADRTAE